MMERVICMLGAALALALVWIAITRRLDVASLVLGSVAVGCVLLVQRTLIPRSDRASAPLWRRPVRLLQFALALAGRFLYSTLFTSWLILSGGEEGRMMALPTRITDPVGRFLLSNAITLTPSTISLLTEDDLLYIHWLQRRSGGGDWRAIKDSLERRILGLFPPANDENR